MFDRFVRFDRFLSRKKLQEKAHAIFDEGLTLGMKSGQLTEDIPSEMDNPKITTNIAFRDAKFSTWHQRTKLLNNNPLTTGEFWWHQKEDGVSESGVDEWGIYQEINENGYMGNMQIDHRGGQTTVRARRFASPTWQYPLEPPNNSLRSIALAREMLIRVYGHSTEELPSRLPGSLSRQQAENILATPAARVQFATYYPQRWIDQQATNLILAKCIDEQGHETYIDYSITPRRFSKTEQRAYRLFGLHVRPASRPFYSDNHEETNIPFDMRKALESYVDPAVKQGRRRAKGLVRASKKIARVVGNLQYDQKAVEHVTHMFFGPVVGDRLLGKRPSPMQTP